MPVAAPHTADRGYAKRGNAKPLLTEARLRPASVDNQLSRGFSRDSSPPVFRRASPC
jgi:hypothetical protein